jgi:hypothetical protein
MKHAIISCRKLQFYSSFCYCGGRGKLSQCPSIPNLIFIVHYSQWKVLHNIYIWGFFDTERYLLFSKLHPKTSFLSFAKHLFMFWWFWLSRTVYQWRQVFSRFVLKKFNCFVQGWVRRRLTVVSVSIERHKPTYMLSDC